MNPSPSNSGLLLEKYQDGLTLSLLAVSVILLIAVTGITIHQQSRLLEQAFARRGAATLQHIAESARPHLLTGDRIALKEILQAVQKTDDEIVGVALWDLDGHLLASTNPQIELPLEPSRLPSVVSTRDYRIGKQLVLVGSIRDEGGTPLGVSYLALSRVGLIRSAFAAAAQIDATVLFLFLLIGGVLHGLLKKVRRLAAQELTLHEQLIRSEKMATLGKLAATMAHEIRNPLGAIKNAIYYIRDGLKGNAALVDDPAITEFMDLADSEIKAATRIIMDLLDFSKTVRLTPTPTDINATLKYVRSTLEIPKNIKFVEAFAPGLPEAMVDPERIRQVFVNLATNAIQAMPNGGELRIQTRLAQTAPSAKPWVIVDFSDTGEGISPDNVPKIFEPLYSTKNNGTGLGLPVSLGIMQAHGGSISVECAPGKGTLFTVRFPLS